MVTINPNMDTNSYNYDLVVKFFDGKTVVSGWILEKVTDTVFIVSNGVLKRKIRLARDLTDLDALFSGIGPQAAARNRIGTIEIIVRGQIVRLKRITGDYGFGMFGGRYLLVSPPVLNARGYAQGMRAIPDGMANGSNMISTLNRTRHYASRLITRSRVVFPTFYLDPINGRDEIELPHGYSFQCAIEPTYQNARNAVKSARYRYLFKSQPTAQYTGLNPSGYIISDWLDHPDVEAGTFFGLWTATTADYNVLAADRKFPYGRRASKSVHDRFDGFRRATTGTIDEGLDFAASGGVLWARNISPPNNSNGVPVYGLAPAMLIVQYADGDQAISVWGDASAYGEGEGQAGSNVANGAIYNYGDFGGDEFSNCGYQERALHRLDLPVAINLSNSDDSYFVSGAQNAKISKRMNLLALSNPTKVWMSLGHNDVIDCGGSVAVFRERATRLLGAISTAAPTTAVIQSTITPHSGSTDNWKTSELQTTDTSFGDSSTPRGVFNADIRNKSVAPWSNISSVFDPNVVVEYGYDGTPTSETSKWVITSLPYRVTYDGMTPNSHGHETIQASVDLYDLGIGTTPTEHIPDNTLWVNGAPLVFNGQYVTMNYQNALTFGGEMLTIGGEPVTLTSP